MKKIVLASKSVDRSELFKRSKIAFEILVTNVDEEQYKNEITDPLELIEKLAEVKALNAKEKLKNESEDIIIIAADTIVEFEGEIIGKAEDERQAFHMLKRFAGKTHKLMTGIAITETKRSKMIIDHEITTVRFIELSDEEIWGYLKTGEWKGRAGAYSIRDKASLFIESLEGSSSNVIGLPMYKVFMILKKSFNTNLIAVDLVSG
jgi:septum formation protein